MTNRLDGATMRPNMPVKKATRKKPSDSPEPASHPVYDLSKLPPKQQLFIIEYPKDFNATQAAIRAGYSKKTANEQGAQLLAKLSHIIEERKREVMRLAGDGIASLAETMRLCTQMAFHNRKVLWDKFGNAREITDLSDDEQLAIAGFEVEELFSGRGESREKVGYLKKFQVEPRAKYVSMLMKFHGVGADKGKLDPKGNRGPNPFEGMPLEKRLALREELTAVLEKHAQGF